VFVQVAYHDVSVEVASHVSGSLQFT
jgi:hypothetical protein